MSSDFLYPPRPANVGRGFHCLAVPLFSLLLVFNTAAIVVILALSCTLQAGRRVLSWLPGMKALGGWLVTSYHRLLQPLADRLLKDPRDEPILAAAISLGLTAGPVFIAQLWLKEISWLLVLLFYAFVYGPNIRGFVRSFSAMHQEGHVPGGIFKRSSLLDRWVGNSFLYMFFAIPMGLIPHAAAHLQQHHRENAGPLDVYATARYDHASAWDFAVYMVREVMYQQFMVSPWLYFKSKHKRSQARAMVMGNLVHVGLFVALACYSLPIAVLYMLVPWCASNFLMGVIHWSQHAFYGGQQDPKDWMYNTVTLLETPVNILNEGYHACHHHWSVGHWSESPALFERLKPELAAAGSMVFRDLSVFGLFVLLMLRRFDALADKLDWWQPLDHAEKVRLLQLRVLPAPIAAHEHAHQRRLATPRNADEPTPAHSALGQP
ncbi:MULTISPECIES: fatty acid desaturase [unclassified Pseudomonas]|uniref:fatty acid desaturase n=1 Tax=unclassified Pseudomonas TaxID=196821 RepID=UPI000BC82CB3|nr:MULTISPECIES: fatty acid desaturase [unclassified Pseudomonas]PXX52153.1 fatty acid desaturase [Pseudomonas sp. LAMO17WK12:I9]WPO46431.1 fatty acid desaturase [Pseudomonas sp. S1Bt23]SNY53462.1 Fatty acid desaturase [Pseudomonas sp. LAMO17WK12:I10]